MTPLTIPDGYTGAGDGVNYNVNQFYSPFNLECSQPRVDGIEL
jgi:hypothetical protein